MKSVRICNILIVIILGIIALFACTGCGPTQEEIKAREEARLERQAHERQEAEVRRQAEEARLAKIRAIETAGDKAAQAGDVDTALLNYKEVLKLFQDNIDEDQRLREKIINFVISLKIQPPITEEARRYAVRAQALLKAKQNAGFVQAADELKSALLLVPWWADGYYNLGLMQEGAADFSASIRSLKLYLLAEPHSNNATAVQNKIYELEVLKEEADKVRAMEGQWTNPSSGVVYTVSMNGNNFQAVNKNGWILRGIKNNNTIEGTITVPPMALWQNNCMSPEYTVPLSGNISVNGKSITFHYMENIYTSSHWNVSVGLLAVNNTGHNQGDCISVTLQGTTPSDITITR
jgi:hypothetical protein